MHRYSEICLFDREANKIMKNMYNEINIADYKTALITLWKAEPELQIAMGLNSFLNIFIPSANDKTPPLPIVYVNNTDQSLIISRIRQLYDHCFSNV